MTRAKRTVSILLLACILVSAAFGFAETQGKAKGNASVYAAPTGDDLALLGTLKDGQTLENLKKHDDEWYVFTYPVGGGSLDGYIRAKDVTLSGDSSGSGASATQENTQDSGPMYESMDSRFEGFPDLTGGDTQAQTPTQAPAPEVAEPPRETEAPAPQTPQTEVQEEIPEPQAPVDPDRPIRMARVSLPSADETLNLRATPDANGEVLHKYLHGYEVRVMQLGDEWTQVDAGDHQGYMMTRHLLVQNEDGTWPVTQPPSEPDPAPAPDSEEAQTFDLPGFITNPNAENIITETPGEDVTPLEPVAPEVTETEAPPTGADETPQTDDTPQSEVTPETATETPTLPPVSPQADEARYAKVTLDSNADSVTLYASADALSETRGSYPNDYILKVIADGDTWTEVDAGDAQGFVETRLLSFRQADGTWAPASGVAGTETEASPTEEITPPSETIPPEETISPEETTLPEATGETGLTDLTAYAKVALPGDAQAASLYESADTASTVLGAYPGEYIVKVVKRDGAFTQVDAGDAQGYMETAMLSFQQADGTWSAPEQEETATAEADTLPTEFAALETQTARQIAVVALPEGETSTELHEAASDASPVKAELPDEQVVTVLRSALGWSQIEVNGTSGYLESEYLVPMSAEDMPTTGNMALTMGAPIQRAKMRLTNSPATVRIYETATGVAAFADYQMENDQLVDVYSRSGTRTLIRFIDELGDGQIHAGYVETALLNFDMTDPTRPTDGQAKVSIPSNMLRLPLYDQPFTGSNIYDSYPNGTLLNVESRYDQYWTEVSLASDPTVTGYMETAYLAFYRNGVWIGGSGGSGGSGNYYTAYVNTSSATAMLPLYSLPIANSSYFISEYRNGTQVTVLDWSSGWAHVRVNADGRTGYMQTPYLSLTWPPSGIQPPGPGQYTYAVVKNTNPWEYLNLRAQPTKNSASLGQYRDGVVVTILQYGVEWCYVQVEGRLGYMMTAFLSFQGSGGGIPGPSGQYAVVNNRDANSRLNLREGPSTSTRSLGLYYNGTMVRILEYGNTWCRVEVQGKTGYMMTYYLSFSGTGGGIGGGGSIGGGVVGGSSAVVNNPNPTHKLNLREGASKSTRSIGRYGNGTPVRVLSYGPEWCHVEVQGKTGYMMTYYLKFTGSSIGGGTGGVAPSPTYSIAIVNNVTGTSLPLHTLPNSASTLGSYPNGSVVTVLEYSSAWTKVRVGGNTGYMQTRYLRFP